MQAARALAYPAADMIRLAPDLRVSFGSPARFGGAEVAWDGKGAVNGHMLVCGPSGVGKTFQLDRIIRTLAEAGAERVHVVSPHGDLCDGLPASLVSTVRFSETSPFGLQVLELSDDPELGGVRRRANAFIDLLARQGALGPRQKTALYRLLVDGYRRFGFEVENPRSWGLEFDPRPGAKAGTKRYPTLSDLRAAVWRRYLMLKTGQTENAVAALEKVLKLAKTRARLRVKLGKAEGEEEANKIQAALEAAQGQAKDAFNEGLAAIDTGDELEELLLWDNADAVKSLYDRLEALERAGIFKGEPPPFDPSKPVWVYDLQPLTAPEQQLFVGCLLERILLSAKAKGRASGPCEFVVVDEAHLFVTDDGESPENRIAKEARKWGLGMILASQSLTHFSDDLLTSSAVKLVLGCAEIYREPLRRKLGLDMVELKSGKKVNPLSFLKPQKTALISVAMRGENRPMVEVDLPSA